MLINDILFLITHFMMQSTLIVKKYITFTIRHRKTKLLKSIISTYMVNSFAPVILF